MSWLEDAIDTEYKITVSGGRLGFKTVDLERDPDRESSIGIAVLWIPEGAKVCEIPWSAEMKKRAEYAYVIDVLRVYDPSENKLKILESVGCGYTLTSGKTEYVKGTIVKPNRFDPTTIQCSNGIHFFDTLFDAVRYACHGVSNKYVWDYYLSASNYTLLQHPSLYWKIVDAVAYCIRHKQLKDEEKEVER